MMNISKKGSQDQAIAPSRTLFIRNIQFETKETQVMQNFEQFGDIKTVFNLIAKRGLIFITFNDLRAAEQGMIQNANLELNGRAASLHYSVPKEGDPPEKAQASVEVTSGNGQPLITHTLFDFMSKYGEIRSMRDDLQRTDKKVVSFWDTRACERALEGLKNETTYQGGPLSAIMSWDDGFEKFAVHAPIERNGQSRDNKPNYNNRVRDYNNNSSNTNSYNNRDTSRNNNRSNYGRNSNGRDRSRSPPRGDRNNYNTGNNYNRSNRDRDYDRPNRDGDNFRIPPAGPPMNLMDYLGNGQGRAPNQPPQGTYSATPAPNFAPPSQPLMNMGGYGAPRVGSLNPGQMNFNPAQAQQMMALLAQMQQGNFQQPVPQNNPQQPIQGYGYSSQSQAPPQQTQQQQQYQPVPPQQQHQPQQTYHPQAPLQQANLDPRLQPAQQKQYPPLVAAQPAVFDPRVAASSKTPYQFSQLQGARGSPIMPSSQIAPVAQQPSASQAQPTQLQALAAMLMKSSKNSQQ